MGDFLSRWNCRCGTECFLLLTLCEHLKQVCYCWSHCVFLNIYWYRTVCTVLIFFPKQKLVTALWMTLMLVCDYIKCTWHVMGKTGNLILSRKCLKSVYLSEGQIVWTLMCKIMLRNWFVWLLNIFCFKMFHTMEYLAPWIKIRTYVKEF
jgi:hypothetical protein